MTDAPQKVRGKYIVIEGPQGVGKTTQVSEIARRLQMAGLPVRVMREPDSQSDLTARAIRQLTQDPRYPMNTRAEVLLYNAARAQSLQVIRQSVEQGVICVVDRNYLTTLAIQYYGRGDVPDYATINNIINFAVGGIEPDLCIIMDAPVNQLVDRMFDRGQGERFDKLGREFMERVRAGYLWEANQRHLPVVDASGNSGEIAEVIWRLVSNTIAMRRPSNALGDADSARQIPGGQVPPSEPPITLNSAQEPAPVQSGDAPSADRTSPPATESTKAAPAISGNTAARSDAPLVVKNENGSYTITNAGREWLQDAVTNIDGPVYATMGKLESLTAAAAMARLSRRGDDMRVTILDEFAGGIGKDDKLIQRVITAYGDDSVQQLVGQHMVVEDASQLLTKRLEWGRMAAYLEQSTRYIYYDQKNAQGQYKYYVPKNLKRDIRKEYIMHMDAIFDIYSKIVHQLTGYISEHSETPEKERDIAWKGAVRAQACDVARAVLPVATKSTVGIFASGQALESLIMHLLSDPLDEARTCGQQVLKEARKVIPSFLERADKPERGGAIVAYRANTFNHVKQIAHSKLSKFHDNGAPSAVDLIEVWPRNELEIVADMLYEHSHIPLRHIKAAVAGWSYDEKQKVMQAYFGERLNRRQRPGRALEKIHYSWDLVCDYGIFRDLQRHRMVDDMEWQELTPRYGFDTPRLIEEAGLLDGFEECFAISLKLHGILQQAGYGLEAQYATLLGHKMRWKVTYNAREAFHLHELRTSPQGHPGYRKLVQEMHNRLADVHPIIAGAMRFVNQGEDEKLTRLAAERYSQYKLDQLDKKHP
jgi:dTMP kinase